MPASNSLKILVIRFSSIGDIVLTTPVVRCLKKQLPNAEVHYLTKPGFQSIVAPNPYLDKVLLLKERLSETIKEIRRERYDYMIDLHNNLRTFLIKRKVNVPSKAFHKLNIEKWLIVNFKINRLPNKHIVDRYLETVKFLDVKNDGEGLDYFIPEEDLVDISQLPGAFQNGYVGLVIGARHFTKQIPEQKAVELIEDCSWPVILLGGPEDSEKAERINKATKEKVFNACGKFSLNQSASLVQQSVLMITGDTGLMHIAAAFKKPMISIWGNTIPAFGMSPYYGKNHSVQQFILENKTLSCRPCSKLGHSKCPKEHFKCMMDLNFEAPLRSIEALPGLPPPPPASPEE